VLGELTRVVVAVEQAEQDPATRGIDQRSTDTLQGVEIDVLTNHLTTVQRSLYHRPRSWLPKGNLIATLGIVTPTPWLPDGHTITVEGRGELFYRHVRHPDPTAPTVLLVHGLTASSDLQFFGLYRALSEVCSFIGIDHRGHGRGSRQHDSFALEDIADDAAALLRALGVGPVYTIGYSMGGPISLLISRRHPDLVTGTIVQATAMEWTGKWWERAGWRLGRVFGAVQRSWLYPHLTRRYIARLLPDGHPNHHYAPWIVDEMGRSDAAGVVKCGYSLSRFDGREWTHTLGKPAAMLITAKDHLVSPKRQRQLADALQATRYELLGDHLSAMEHPDEYARATITLLTDLVDRCDRRRLVPEARAASAERSETVMR
jgi:pimeloyl-ACP methyl ester carboxylesterase